MTDNKDRITHSYAKDKTEQIRETVKREMCSAAEKASDTQVRLEYTGSSWDSMNLGIGLAEMIGGAALTVFGAGGTVLSGGTASPVSIPAAGAGIVTAGVGVVTVHSALQNMFAIQVSHSSSSSTNSNDKSQTDKKESSGSGSNAGKNSGSTQGGGGTERIPERVKDIAQQIKNNNGTPPKGYKGGKEYGNNPENGGQKLPEHIEYREYDVNPYVKGQNRGMERLVIGDDGSVWYTNDHYQTFIRLE